MNRQQHPDGAKAQARTIYQAHGSRRAAEVSGISRRTINAWAKAEGWQRHLAAQQPPHLHVAPVADTAGPAGKRTVAAGWPMRRQQQLDRYAQLVDAALDKAEQAMEANKPYHAKAYAITAGVFTDKVEVLAKQVREQGTAGEPVDVAASVARLQQLVDAAEGRAGA